MIDAVIFDMDGVLIDSVGAAHRAKSELLARHGIDVNTVPDPHHEAHRGSSVQTLLRAVKKQHGITIDKETFSREATELVYKNLQEEAVSVDPALISFLEELQQHRIACAVTTSGLRNSVTNKFRILGIARYFTLIVTANDVAEHKPDPASYLHTMNVLGARPDHCIIFEDSAAGIAAGCAAGGIVVGFTGYNPGKGELPDTQLTIRSWNDISYEKLLKLSPE